MSSSETVYALSSGEYSSYSVDLVFPPGTTREEAEAAAERLNRGRWSTFEVEEFSLVPADRVGSLRVLLMRAIVGLVNGDLLSEDEETYGVVDPADYKGIDECHWRPQRHWVERGWKITEDVNGDLVYSRRDGYWTATQGVLTVKGTDHERVRKVFSEKLAMVRSDPTVRLLVEGTDWSELLPDNASA